MIVLENLSKSFGSHLLFDGISFKVNPKERIGLVGRNGHGKTTLFRIIAGEVYPDAGAIIIPKNYRLGYVRQEIEFTADSVLAEGSKGLPKDEAGHYWKVEKILAGLGFSHNDMQRHPKEFSGGYQVRLNLAKVLISEPDLLLLDEPTNYLDITSIRWIERFLNEWPREVMLITHDRSFMDKVVTHTLGLQHRKIKKITGNTEKYYTQIAQEEEIHEKTRINAERRQKEIEQFISRFRAKARLANLVQSRIKTLQKMETAVTHEAIKTLDFSFRSKPFRGKHVLSVDNLSFSYDPEKPLIKDFELTLHSNDRVCVIGKNGKGKTTLLKLIAGILSPRKGNIRYNPNIEIGFFEQTNIRHLVDNRTVLDEILYTQPDVDQQQARNICGAMLFEGDQALKKIQVLSGGEKSRVMLGKLLVTPTNLLILDEPTNHLDMDSCDALLAAIDNFKGTVLMVTHNEMFLHALANRLVVFQNDTTETYEGSYQDFLDRVGWKDERNGNGSKPEEPSTSSAAKMTRKAFRRQRSEIIADRSKALKEINRKIARLENDIETHEEKMQLLNLEMIEVSRMQNGTKIATISKSLNTCQKKIESLFEELEKLTEIQESKLAVFDEQLKQLNGETH